MLDQTLPEVPGGADDDWNVGVVFLGSNYRGDPLAYENELREMITRLAPRPTLLLTVTEYRPEWSEVNAVVERLADEYDNVTLLDWKTIAEEPGILSGDRLHPTESGREMLAQSVAAVLGPVSAQPGECLGSQFRDDSAVGTDAPAVLGPPSASTDGSTSSGSGSSGGSGSGSSSGSGGTQTTTTTAPPAVTTTTTTAPAVTTTTAATTTTSTTTTTTPTPP